MDLMGLDVRVGKGREEGISRMEFSRFTREYKLQSTVLRTIIVFCLLQLSNM